MELEVPEIKRNLSVNEYQRLRPRSLSPDPRHLSPQPPVRISLAAIYLLKEVKKLIVCPRTYDCASLAMNQNINYCSILEYSWF